MRGIFAATEGEDGALSYGTAGSMLDKYDAEGYRYIYVVREYMTGGTVQYEQVFGEVDEDGADSGDVVEGVPGGERPTSTTAASSATGARAASRPARPRTGTPPPSRRSSRTSRSC